MISTDPYYKKTLIKDDWELRLIVDLTPMENRTYNCAMDVRPLPDGRRWGNLDRRISFEMFNAIKDDEEDFYLNYFLADLKSKYPNVSR